MSTTAATELRHQFVDVEGARLHYVIAGSGPLMLFVHGFPQHWYAFRHQLAEFAKDHTVVAVDLRSVNLSSRPKNLRDNGVWVAADDMKCLVQHLGFSTCIMVGHDWGTAVGYSFALHHREMLDRLVVMSGSHPATFDRELHCNESQIVGGKHWLMLRRPDSAAKIAANDFEALKRTFAEHSFFTKEDLEAYLAAWRQPGAIEGMVAWYHAEGWGPADGLSPAHGNYVHEISPQIITMPTLVIYGDRDKFLVPQNYDGLDKYVPHLTIHRIEGGSHWILDEHPALINRYIRAFLESASARHQAAQ
ncbi:pimeloyl-ACP methyl ester carboxylesterase [Bradyrhizobium sp. AZCC 1678]|uniref:alpha/beta fold hydrolase n=1 Tax=Bradyrhizobium sp. AZCC 1678 TaxID=3117030 RepID=UPI002FF2AA8F